MLIIEDFPGTCGELTKAMVSTFTQRKYWYIKSGVIGRETFLNECSLGNLGIYPLRLIGALVNHKDPTVAETIEAARLRSLCHFNQGIKEAVTDKGTWFLPEFQIPR